MLGPGPGSHHTVCMSPSSYGSLWHCLYPRMPDACLFPALSAAADFLFTDLLGKGALAACHSQGRESTVLDSDQQCALS
jgi:hypothetical protein